MTDGEGSIGFFHFVHSSFVNDPFYLFIIQYWSRVSRDNNTALLMAEVLVTSYPTVQTIRNNIINYIY